MIDFGFDKIALIGAVALIVIGPEKLPRVARTVGTLLGKAQRYVADVKAEVNRFDGARRAAEDEGDSARPRRATSEHRAARGRRRQPGLRVELERRDCGSGGAGTTPMTLVEPLAPPPPTYKQPKKKWRIKQGATPDWYKARNGIRTKALSGAARVARYRPPRVQLMSN